MVDTPRTRAYLLANEFQDGQASGSIHAQQVRDLIATMTIRDVTTNVKFPEHGAIGDGSSHAASSVYGSLAELQAVYGTTVGGITIALTNELDWLAIQHAIDSLASGGLVYIPTGTYVMTNTNSVSDGSGTLLLPIADVVNPTTGVSLFGEWTGTRLKWNNDLGATRFAVICGGTTRPNNNSSAGYFEGIWFQGPGVGTTVGSSSTNMVGVGTNDRRNFYKCHITDFKVGLSIIGGQCIYVDMRIGACYYGFYFDNPSTLNFGNGAVIRCLSDGNYGAAIAVHHAANIGAWWFEQSFFGTAPFSILKETNSGSPTSVLVVADTTFDSCQFEGIGNALVSDDIATQASHVAQIENAWFRNCEMSFGDTTWKLAARAQASLIDVDGLNGFYVYPMTPTIMSPGTVSIFYANSIGTLVIEGDVNQLIANCNSAGVPMFVGAGWSYGTVVLRNTGYQWHWEGFVVTNQDAVSGVNTVMIQSPGSDINQTVRCTGATTDAVMGVMMYNPTPASAGSLCIVAHTGYVVAKSSGTITTGKYCRTTTAGAVIAASNSADATTPMVGICMQPASGNLVTLRLRGLQ